MEVECDVAIGGIANNCSTAPLMLLADAPAGRTSSSFIYFTTKLRGQAQVYRWHHDAKRCSYTVTVNTFSIGRADVVMVSIGPWWLTCHGVGLRQRLYGSTVGRLMGRGLGLSARLTCESWPLHTRRSSTELLSGCCGCAVIIVSVYIFIKTDLQGTCGDVSVACMGR